jgi:Na+-driven multidrug efflux pump
MPVKDPIEEGAHRPAWRRVVGTSLPLVVGQLAFQLYVVAEMAMLGRLSAEAFAAAGVSWYASRLLLGSPTSGVQPAVQALVARSAGLARWETAAGVLQAARRATVLIVGPVTVLLSLSAPALARWLITDPVLAETTAPYLRLRLVGDGLLVLCTAHFGYFVGLGRTALVERAGLVLAGSAVIGVAVLTFGAGPVPALGLQGAAWAWLGATALTLFFCAWAAARLEAELAGPSRAREVPERVYRTLAQLALPVGLSNLSHMASYNVALKIAQLSGPVDLVAVTLLFRFASALAVPALALGRGTAALAGRALGRREPAEGLRWSRVMTRISGILYLCLGLPMLLWPSGVTLLLMPDADVASAAHGAIQVLGLSLTFEGMALALLQLLMGTGGARTVATANLLMQWLFFIPLGYLLGVTLELGATGLILGRGLSLAWAFLFIRRQLKRQWGPPAAEAPSAARAGGA